MNTSRPRKKTIRYWPLWIPRVLLLIYILGPFFNTIKKYAFTERLSPRFWDFDPFIVPMISMAILLLIAWFKPYFGGILILIASIIIIFSGFLACDGSDTGYSAGFGLMIWSCLLVIPGVLFLVMGRHKAK
jgi:hypothetical protein